MPFKCWSVPSREAFVEAFAACYVAPSSFTWSCQVRGWVIREYLGPLPDFAATSMVRVVWDELRTAN